MEEKPKIKMVKRGNWMTYYTWNEARDKYSKLITNKINKVAPRLKHPRPEPKKVRIIKLIEAGWYDAGQISRIVGCKRGWAWELLKRYYRTS
jgi:hypothetical protein